MTNPLPVKYLLDEHQDMSDVEVARLYAEVVDRWTWDTGSEEDAKLMRKVGAEHRWRKDRAKPREKSENADDIELAFAREISEEIDREILRDLINIADDIKT